MNPIMRTLKSNCSSTKNGAGGILSLPSHKKGLYMDTTELQKVIDHLEDTTNKLLDHKKCLQKCFEFHIQPEHISTSGLNLFKALSYRYVYAPTPHMRKIAIKLVMGCGQEKTVKFNEEPNRIAVDELKQALRRGDAVYVSLYDIILMSYRFNESSGISFYSNGFRIMKIIP